jgi:hypothetical protein
MGQRSITPVSDALIAVPHLPLAATTTDLLVRRLAGAGVVAVSKDAERFARVVGRGRLEEEGDTGDDWGREGDEGDQDEGEEDEREEEHDAVVVRELVDGHGE